MPQLLLREGWVPPIDKCRGSFALPPRARTSTRKTAMWRSNTFFRRVFGFDEDEYSVTRDNLLAVATFTAPPTGSVAAIASLSATAERCVFNVGDRRFDAGIFFEPSVAELRTFVSQRLADPEVCEAVSAAATRHEGAMAGATL